jgi:thiol-disulfide isomerase/thioredoxin
VVAHQRIEISRRAVALAAVSLALAPGAGADALSVWDRTRAGATVRGDVDLVAGGGRINFAEEIAGRATVLIAWASWCGPCMAEKPAKRALAARLEAANAKCRLLMVQCFDPGPRREGLQATPGFEAFLRETFGLSPVDPKRISLPSALLIGSDGREIGRLQGMPRVGSFEPPYWEAETTYRFLLGLS